MRMAMIGLGRMGRGMATRLLRDGHQVVAFNRSENKTRKLAEEESERLLRMEEILHQRVIGQEEAVRAVSRAIRRARAGLKDPKRPIGSFIFFGTHRCW